MTSTTSTSTISNPNDKSRFLSPPPPRASRIAQARPASSPPKIRDVKIPVRPLTTTAPNLLEEPDDSSDPGTLPTDQVFDETDQAQWMQLREQADINRRGREMNRPEQHPDFDGEHCIDCDDKIPALRIEMQKIRCVDCQQALEDDAARRRRLLGS